VHMLTEGKAYTKLDVLRRTILVIFLIASLVVFIGAYAAAL